MQLPQARLVCQGGAGGTLGAVKRLFGRAVGVVRAPRCATVAKFRQQAATLIAALQLTLQQPLPLFGSQDRQELATVERPGLLQTVDCIALFA